MQNILNLLLLCGILCQGILGTLADDDIKESSDVLVRNKRVLNRIRTGDRPVPIESTPYVVNIKRNNRLHCVGSILSHHTVITIPKCVAFPINTFSIYSGEASATGGKFHSMITKKEHFGNHPNREMDGVALFTVYPPFVYSTTTRNIELHTGLLLPNFITGLVTGWGHNCGPDAGTKYAKELRSISVPIISHRDCVNSYSGVQEIFDSDICTLDRYKQCGHTDPGAPLVVNNSLAGVHLWGGRMNYIDRPDVFAIVQHPDYITWIVNNIVHGN